MDRTALEAGHHAPNEAEGMPDVNGMHVNLLVSRRDEMPHVGPRTRAESVSSRQHEAVTPPSGAHHHSVGHRNYINNFS